MKKNCRLKIIFTIFGETVLIAHSNFFEGLQIGPCLFGQFFHINLLVKEGMLFAFYAFQVVFEILYVSLFFTSWADSKLSVKKSELKVCVNIKSLEFDLHFFI